MTVNLNIQPQPAPYTCESQISIPPTEPAAEEDAQALPAILRQKLFFDLFSLFSLPRWMSSFFGYVVTATNRLPPCAQHCSKIIFKPDEKLRKLRNCQCWHLKWPMNQESLAKLKAEDLPSAAGPHSPAAAPRKMSAMERGALYIEAGLAKQHLPTKNIDCRRML